MADLVLDVEARGTAQAAAGMDKVATSTAKAGATWDQLKRKLGSGEVLRNAAASAALLATGAGNTTQKVAALGGALASIPGPVGMVAAAVAVGATVLDTFAQSAAQAEKKAAELAATLADLGKQRTAAQVALGGKLAAAGALGPEARAFSLAGGRRSERNALQELSPGDAAAGLRQATMLARSGLPEDLRAKAVGVAGEASKFGFQVTDESIQRLIRALADEAEARTGTGTAGANPRTGATGRGAEVVGDAELISEMLGGMVTQAEVISRAQESQTAEARAAADNVRRITETAVMDAVRNAEAAVTGARSGVAREAIGVQGSQQFSQSVQGMTAAVVEATKRIDAVTRGSAAPAPQATSAWMGSAFQYQPAERSKP